MKVYSMKFILNGKEVEIESNVTLPTLSYTELCSLANLEIDNKYSVTFRCNINNHIHGELLPGQSMNVVDGLIVNIVDTSKS